MKTKYKARAMFSTEQFFTKPGIAEKLLRDPGLQLRFTVPVIVVPATPEAYDAQVEAIARGIMASGYRAAKAEYDIPGGIYQARKPNAADLKWYTRHAKAALAAIGIKRPGAKEGEKTL